MVMPMKLLLAGMFFFAGTFAAAAACDAPATQSNDRIQFFLGIEPSDGPLDVWCRIQSLQGAFKVNVWFPAKEVNAHKSMDVVFDGTPSRDRMEFATFLQSILPTTAETIRGENGADFGIVLESAVQGLADRAKDGQELGFSSKYDMSREIALWEPMTLRVRPVMIAGIEFTLEVSFKPSVGRFIEALEGHADDLILRGYHERVLRNAGVVRTSCPPEVPDCLDLPKDVIDLHAPWVLQDVIIRADGKSLSAAAISVLGNIEAQYRDLMGFSIMQQFKPTVGDARFEVSTVNREILARADADPDGTSGSSNVRVMWRERPQTPTTYDSALRAYALSAREAMVLTSAEQ